MLYPTTYPSDTGLSLWLLTVLSNRETAAGTNPNSAMICILTPSVSGSLTLHACVLVNHQRQRVGVTIIVTTASIRRVCSSYMG
jgi:hypothetical protein